MIELNNYNLSEKIYENKRFLIQRGVRESDKKSIMLKTFQIILKNS